MNRGVSAGELQPKLHTDLLNEKEASLPSWLIEKTVNEVFIETLPAITRRARSAVSRTLFRYSTSQLGYGWLRRLSAFLSACPDVGR